MRVVPRGGSIAFTPANNGDSFRLRSNILNGDFASTKRSDRVAQWRSNWKYAELSRAEITQKKWLYLLPFSGYIRSPDADLMKRICATSAFLLSIGMAAFSQCTGVSIGISTLVPNGNWLVPTVPADPAPHPWPNNYPPIGTFFGAPSTSVCTVCPAIFEVPICASQYAQVYLCRDNYYSFSLCTSAAASDFSLSVTTTTFDSIPVWSAGGVFDNDGCGTVDGPAEIGFAPSINGLYRVRVLRNPCVVDPALCGTLRITCAASAVGIGENRSGNTDLSITPNPASDRVLIRSALVGAGTLSLLDADGRMVSAGRMTSASHGEFDVERLAPGMYTVILENPLGDRAQGRFVKL